MHDTVARARFPLEHVKKTAGPRALLEDEVGKMRICQPHHHQVADHIKRVRKSRFQTTFGKSPMSIHLFQFIHFNSFISIPSCHFIHFNSFISTHSFQVIHINSFISVHSFSEMNKCGCRFLWL